MHLCEYIQERNMVTESLTQEITRLHADICSALADNRRILILYALHDQPKRDGSGPWGLYGFR